MKKKILGLLLALSMVFSIAVLTPAVSAADGGISINDVRHGVAVIECGPANASTGSYDLADQVFRGSCFFVGVHGTDPQYLVTNYHVIQSFVENGSGELMTETFMVDGTAYKYDYRMKIRVYYSANDFEEAYLVDSDSVKDIALLKIANPTNKRAALHLEPPVDSMSFSDVWVVGFPGNAENVIAGSVSSYGETDAVGKKGVISKIFIQQSTGTTEIQTDCEINGGNSGGPMVNEKGKVVGVATYTVYTAEAITNELGVIKEQKYAIGSDMVATILTRNNVKYSTDDYSGGTGSLSEGDGSAPASVSVNFDGNGGVPAQASAQVAAGGSYGSLPTATNGIMEFDGWYTDPAAGDRITANSNAPGSGSVTLYAHWKIPVWIWIVAVALVLIIVAVVIIAVAGSKKGKGAAAQTPAPAPAPAPAPVQPVSPTMPARPQRRAVIRSMAAQHKGQSITVTERPVSLGRSAKDCAIVYNGDTAGVSSVHCSISYDGGRNEFMVTDVSTYGTFMLNGQKLPKGVPTNVKPGTSLYLGDKGNVITLSVE
ncbi:MAG: trypsin-like peptidase domain-containing protein [Ruminiclostridium sp.]|nr:trypsin-like peptidase domain-containing protein [Ruminiclostridium sp.]